MYWNIGEKSHTSQDQTHQNSMWHLNGNFKSQTRQKYLSIVLQVLGDHRQPPRLPCLAKEYLLRVEWQWKITHNAGWQKQRWWLILVINWTYVVKGIQFEKFLLSYWPAGMYLGHFLDCSLMLRCPAHWGWYHPYTYGPPLCKKGGWVSMRLGASQHLAAGHSFSFKLIHWIPCLAYFNDKW